MAKIPNDQDEYFLPSGPPARRSPHDVVSEIASYISASIRLTLWLILAALVACTAFVALKAMLFVSHMILKAVGI